ncbi:hypothetical protein GGF31_001628 [Allomyces arbusculus]|nr:hypothetical protein GGF31_001628 [Allomyces arbusculus]
MRRTQAVRGADKPLLALRIVLMHASPYFRAMFSGQWAESSSPAPIVLRSWLTPTVAPVFIHMYSGWLPVNPLPSETSAKVLANFRCELHIFGLTIWRNLLEYAEMLGLNALALATNRQIVDLLD